MGAHHVLNNGFDTLVSWDRIYALMGPFTTQIGSSESRLRNVDIKRSRIENVYIEKRVY